MDRRFSRTMAHCNSNKALRPIDLSFGNYKNVLAFILDACVHRDSNAKRTMQMNMLYGKIEIHIYTRPNPNRIVHSDRPQ